MNTYVIPMNGGTAMIWKTYTSRQYNFDMTASVDQICWMRSCASRKGMQPDK